MEPYTVPYTKLPLVYDLQPPRVHLPNIPSALTPSPSQRLTTIDHCRVAFGPGFQILDLFTPFESPHVIISNVPHEMSTQDIHALLAPLSLQPFILRRPPNLADSRRCKAICFAHFQSPQQALQAVKHLHGMQFPGLRLVARIKTTPIGGPSQVRTSSVSVRWKLPSVTAFVKFPTFSQACALQRTLDGFVYSDRSLEVTHQTESRRLANEYTLRIDGFTPNTTLPDVVQLTGTSLVKLVGKRNYASFGSCVKTVRSLLEDIAPLVSLQQRAGRADSKEALVWAEFSQPEEAVAARDRLHGMSLPQLGDASLSVQWSQSLVYWISSAIFSHIRQHVEDIKLEGESCQQLVKVKWSDSPDKAAVRLVLEGQNIVSLSRLKMKLESILSGEPLREPSGSYLWIGAFVQSDSLAFLEKLGNDVGAHIRCDSKNARLALYGPLSARLVCESRIRAFAKGLDQSTHRFALKSRSLAFMLKGGGLADLERQHGRHRVQLDLEGRCLVVHSNEKIAKAVRLAIHNVVHSLAPSNIANDSQTTAPTCSVCLTDLHDAVILPCGHTYCKECLQQYLVSLTETKAFPARCVASVDPCSPFIAVELAGSLLSQAEKTSLMHSAFEAYIQRHPKDFQHCPSPGCSLIYRTSSSPDPAPLQCPSCLILICTYCHVEHLGLTCNEYVDNRDKLPEEWKSKHGVKSCPRCGTNLERVAGCNHVVCGACHIHMCWQCLKTYQRSDEVYQHMVVEHGGIDGL